MIFLIGKTGKVPIIGHFHIFGIGIVMIIPEKHVEISKKNNFRAVNENGEVKYAVEIRFKMFSLDFFDISTVISNSQVL